MTEWETMMLIMAARQYDATVALFAKFADADEVQGLLDRHKRGEILGPPPALFIPKEPSDADNADETDNKSND